MLAVSSSSTVTLWDTRQHSTISYEPSPDHLVSDLCWNGGTSLASCAVTRGNVHVAVTSVNNILSLEDEPLTLFSEYTLPATANAINPPSISFGAKTRYLSVSSGNDILIFDNKRNGQVVRTFSLPATESSSQNFCSKACIVGDLVAAASSSDAALYLFRLKESGMPPVRLYPKTQPVGSSALCFEPHSNQSAAVGLINGFVHVWDVLQGSLNCSIDTTLVRAGEECPIIDLCYSPLNSRLLASCSKSTVFFHDATSAKSLSTISMTENGAACCTALSLDNSGSQCAVGTSTGEVLLYDLRKSSACIEKLSVSDNRAVARVRFQRLQSSLRLSTASKEGSGSEILARHKQKPHIKPNSDVGGNQVDGATQPACSNRQEPQGVGAVMPQIFNDATRDSVQPACSNGQHTASCVEALASVSRKLSSHQPQKNRTTSKKHNGLGVVEHLLTSLLDSDSLRLGPSRRRSSSGEESDDSSCNFNVGKGVVVCSEKGNDAFLPEVEKTAKPLCMVCDKYIRLGK